MKHAWFFVVIALASGCGRVVSEQDCPDCTDDPAGCTGEDCAPPEDDAGTPGSCALASAPGPAGILVGYEAVAGTEWLLTRTEDDGYTTLWESTATGWRNRALGATCIHGLMTIDSQDRPNLACLVRNGATLAYDLRVFTVEPQAITSALLIEGDVSPSWGSWNALPLSFELDAAGRPNLLWRGAIDLVKPDLTGMVGLGRLTGTTWSDVGVYNNSHLSEPARLVAAGGELLVVYRDVTTWTLKIANAGSSVADLLEVSASPVEPGDAIEVAGDDNGAVHVLVADVATGGLTYHRKLGGTSVETRIDGVPPVGDGRVGGDAVSIALDPAGAPVVSYHADTTNALRVARKTGNMWMTKELGTGGTRSKVLIDGAGRMRVASQDDLGQIELLREECTP